MMTGAGSTQLGDEDVAAFDGCRPVRTDARMLLHPPPSPTSVHQPGASRILQDRQRRPVIGAGRSDVRVGHERSS